MTVNSTNIVSGPYPGNGIADTFNYGFRIEDKTQLKVFETDDEGVETELTVDTDYTVAGIGVDAGGTVTRVAGALPTGYTWYIRSDYDQTQLTAFGSQGGFFPDVHEAAMDKLTFLIQQIQDLLNRSLRVSESYTGSSITALPNPASQNYLRWKTDLSGLENVEVVTPTGSVTVGVNIGNIVELIDDGSGNAVFPSAQLKNLPADAVDTAQIVDRAVTVAKIAALTSSRALATDLNGNIVVSDVTAAELAYLDGVTSNIQDQLDDKVAVQVTQMQTGSSSSGTTSITLDDTIPQITEGDEFLSRTHTPKSATNRLLIMVDWNGTSESDSSLVMALFKDTDADAIAATWNYQTAGNHTEAMHITHDMVAGGTDEITFSVRVGTNSTGVARMNGSAGARKLGGVLASGIKIIEYTP